jgi:DNA-binding NarL/FixJ family response regulator
MKRIRVILVEDHTLVRAGIRSLLQTLEHVEVVAEASNGHTALQLIEQHQPEVVLLDINMPGLNGLEVARGAKRYPKVRIILLSGHANEEYVWQALRAGVAGYLLKDAGTAELELAINAVVAGDSYLSPAVSKHVVASYARSVGNELSAFERLTPRQREIMQLIAEGNTTKAIAHKLNISVKTVETHRSQLMEHLNLHDIASLVRYAIRVGLVQTDT